MPSFKPVSLKTLLLSEVTPLGKKKRDHYEANYRRGYVHGAIAAYDAFESGASLREVVRWIDNQLTPWRYRRDKENAFIPPPEPKGRRK